MEEIRLKFGNNIRKFRKLKNLSIESLAEKSNLNPKYLGSVERAESNISFDNIINLSKALDIEPSELFIFNENINLDLYYLILNLKKENIEHILELLKLINNDSEQNLHLYKEMIKLIQENLKL